ncbi:MAG: hypothetical protein M3Y49_02210, partial [Actinomycetota bacterium]|nr:hypothetical protein [Actinomycetota bacterium]
VDVQVRQGHDPSALTVQLSNLSGKPVSVQPPDPRPADSAGAPAPGILIPPFGIAHTDVSGSAHSDHAPPCPQPGK